MWKGMILLIILIILISQVESEDNCQNDDQCDKFMTECDTVAKICICRNGYTLRSKTDQCVKQYPSRNCFNDTNCVDPLICTNKKCACRHPSQKYNGENCVDEKTKRESKNNVENYIFLVIFVTLPVMVIVAFAGFIGSATTKTSTNRRLPLSRQSTDNPPDSPSSVNTISRIVETQEHTPRMNNRSETFLSSLPLSPTLTSPPSSPISDDDSYSSLSETYSIESSNPQILVDNRAFLDHLDSIWFPQPENTSDFARPPLARTQSVSDDYVGNRSYPTSSNVTPSIDTDHRYIDDYDGEEIARQASLRHYRSSSYVGTTQPPEYNDLPPPSYQTVISKSTCDLSSHLDPNNQ